MQRRTFVKTSGALALGTLAAMPTSCSKIRHIGAQLYTVRDDMEKDPKQTLAKIAEIGYRYVEGTGYHSGQFYGLSPKDFKKVLTDLNLSMPSGHIADGIEPSDNTTTMSKNWEQAVADAAEIGQSHMVLAWLNPPVRQNLDDYRRVIDMLNTCGEVTKQYGIQMAYHNHDFEFVPMEGQLPYDLILTQTDPDLVHLEMDFYWIEKAGKDPYAYFAQYPQRFPLWHIKDMASGEGAPFTELGNGTIDWAEVFASKKQSGMQRFFVEQDSNWTKSPLESLETSYEYLQQEVF